jgi:hypothetical protein
LIVTEGTASAVLFPNRGVVPLVTAGVMEPRPVAVITTLFSGAAFTTAVFAETGKPRLDP